MPLPWPLRKADNDKVENAAEKWIEIPPMGAITGLLKGKALLYLATCGARTSRLAESSPPPSSLLRWLLSRLVR